MVDTESLCLIAAMNFENQHSIEKDVSLVDIHRVEPGDLLEPGYLVDWASLSSILETHLGDKLS